MPDLWKMKEISELTKLIVPCINRFVDYCLILHKDCSEPTRDCNLYANYLYTHRDRFNGDDEDRQIEFGDMGLAEEIKRHIETWEKK